MQHNPDFRPPADSGAHAVLIGPGTGVAPFRAFLRGALGEQQQTHGPPATSGMTLFFGCRYEQGDFLYRDELQEASRQNPDYFTW